MRVCAFAVAMMVPIGISAAHAAERSAKPGQMPVLKPVPLGSPADWLSPDDYPIAALRYAMSGTTAFRLKVDAAGTPQSCEIVSSSGFDVLDTATCDRLMRNAKFTPPRNKAGIVIASTYASRVVWKMPEDVGDFRPSSYAVDVTIRSDGTIDDCVKVDGGLKSDEENPCRSLTDMPRDVALAMRASRGGEGVDVRLELGAGFGKAPPVRLLAPVAGFERLALSTFAFAVDAKGSVNECRMVEQRGDPLLISGFCDQIARMKFYPPSDEVAADGTAQGWSVGRVLKRPTPSRPRETGIVPVRAP